MSTLRFLLLSVAVLTLSASAHADGIPLDAGLSSTIHAPGVGPPAPAASPSIDAGLTVLAPSVTTTVTTTSTTSPAPAAITVPPLEEPVSLIQQMLGAGKSGQWWILGVLIANLLIWISRYILAQYVPWFSTDKGGMYLALIIGVLAAVAATFAGGKPTGNSITDGLRLGFTAIGTYVASRKTIKPDKVTVTPD